MDSLSKVIWAEGIFLSQQHFQAWERHQDFQHQVRNKAVSPFQWGILKLEIDESALRLGQFRIRQFKGIFPDGRLVAFKENAEMSLTIDLTQSRDNQIDIFLGLPSNNAASGISGYQNQGQLNAWNIDFQEVPDEHDPTRVREVMLARPNLKLIVSGESLEQFIWIKVAKLNRVSDKEFELSSEFIPAVMSLNSDRQLSRMLSETMQLVSAKVSQAVDAAKQVGNLFEYNHQDMIRLHRSQIMNQALVHLKHLVRYPDIHPEQYYFTLADLLAKLSPIEKPEMILNLPEYNPLELYSVFKKIDDSLRVVFKEVVRTASERVQLNKEFEGLYRAQGLTVAKLNAENFYLAVYHESQNPSWITEFAMQTKVGASQHIEMIVASALPGVRIVHTQRPPSSLATKSGYEYFRLESAGDFWQQIIDSESLSVFLPYGFQQATIELVSVED